MNEMTKVVVVGAIGFLTTFGCGGDKPQVKPPEPATTASAEPAATAPASSGSAMASASAAPFEAPKPPAMKGTIASLTRSPPSGKVDKIGEKDGNFKPDGVKDAVFDVEYSGEATAFFLMTTDATGALTSEFDADTIVGDQKIPAELQPIFNAGKNTAGLAVYEGDKLLNGKDGGLAAPLAAGTHKLSLHVSSKNLPKSAFTVYALLPDGNLVKGPVLSK
jgi:hypothetical protein